jgi:hypothetical protein
MGIGGLSFGSGPFGSESSGSEYNLTGAVSSADNSVDLTFGADLDFLDPSTGDPASYTFDNGLVCIFVTKITESVIRLYTTSQIIGTTYTVTVSLAVESVDGATLDVRTAEFMRAVSAGVYAATEVQARTHCQGRRIDLFWSNPTPPPVLVKIVRRRKNWVFDLTDPHEVVYEGDLIDSFADTGVIQPQTTTVADVAAEATIILVADDTGFSPGYRIRVETLTGPVNYEIVTITVITPGSFEVTPPLVNAYASGARVSVSSPLVEQTFYYYTVLVSDIPTPPDFSFAFTDDNHAMGLSISVMDGKEDFFWNNTAAELRNRDAVGEKGAGFLDQWYDVLGCWLNIMRGTAKALKLMGNNDEAPYNSLSAKNFSLGIDPEGFSYDFEIPRRTISSLAKVYKRRGTCNGLVLATRMFTKWDAVCAEFAVGGCNTGARPLSTWDGQALADGNTDAGIVLTNPTVVDAAKTYPPGQWKDGMLVGALGDVCCVDDNTETVITLKVPTTRRLMNVVGGPISGNLVGLDSTSGFYVGMTVQLEQAADPTAVQIIEITNIVVNTSISSKEPLRFNFLQDDYVSIQKSTIRTEVVSTGTWSTVSGTIRELTDGMTPTWVQTQWVGYQVLTVDNEKFTVLSNEDGTLQIDAPSLPTDGAFAVAKDFVVGASFGLRTAVPSYKVYSGAHSFIFEPTLDIEERGTIFDPYSRIWMGVGSPILGAWGPGDVGIYITSPVTVVKGLDGSVVGSVLTLDPTELAPTVNSLVGYFLNPNQNQNQLFLILSNTTTTITVATDISSLVVPGQAYYVLKPRDANRYRQLVGRFGTPAREFAHLDIDVRVLFV